MDKYFMKAGNDKLLTLQIPCSVRFPPIPRLSALQKNLYQTLLKHASPGATKSPITIVDGGTTGKVNVMIFE